MKQIVYEEIQRMNLLSSYDNSKTLSEQNNRILKEASQEVYNKLYEKFPCMLNLKNAQYIDDASNEGIDFEKSRYIWWNGVTYYPDGTKYGKNGFERFTCDSPEFKTQTQKVSGQKSNQVVKQVSKTAPVAIPPELENAEGVKKFQQWLDNNHSDDDEGKGKGWASRYKDGKIEQGKNGGGYGTYGPRTQKAWKNQTYRDAYLSRIQRLKSDAEESAAAVAVPAAAQPAATTTEGPKGASYTDEKTGGFYKWNGTEYEFQQNYLAPSDGIVYTWDGTRYVGTE
jgi:hypothetical protein